MADRHAKEIEYIVSYMEHEIYKIIRADLTNDSCEIIKAIDGEEESHSGRLSVWMRSLADEGKIHPADTARYLAATDLEHIRNHFLAGNRKLSISYRRLMGHSYTWVSLRVIPDLDYSPENQKVVMFVQDDDSAESLDLIQTAKQQFVIMKSLSKIYVSLHAIDLANDNAYDLSNQGEDTVSFERIPNASEVMRRFMNARVTEKYLDEMLAFTDLSTISQRMKEKKVLTAEFVGKTVGWCRAQFVSILDNPDGSAAYVLFSTTAIDDDKKREEQLMRISTELDLATAIQNNVIPHTFPAFPEREEFDLYASMDPAKEVGGDFYDFFAIDEKHLGLVIADVSGKGIPAALFMMISKVLIKNRAEMVSSPAKVLELVNRQLCENNQAEMFVTVWFGILNTETGLITAANAGHEYPVIKRAGGSFELFRDRHGFVLGGLDDVRFRDYEIQLDKGDVLFLHTDGVPEANNPEEKLFGMEAMLASLNSADGGSGCRELLGTLRRDLDAFTRNAPQFDDITMLALKFNGSNR